MLALPIDEQIPVLIETLLERRMAVVVAEPGAGKTTRVPPALVDRSLLHAHHPGVILLQPRRVAARAAAARIAEERGWQLGREVGYQVRFERRMSASTRLRIMTEGILTRQLLDDPELTGIGAVILDEFHERSIHTDLALAMLREVREGLRGDLILIVMSATLDAEPVARFLGGAPIIRTTARPHEVTISHQPPAGVRQQVASSVQSALQGVLDDPTARWCAGHVLVFLPGIDEIRRVAAAVGALAERHQLDVLPLHGSLDAEDQDRALRPSPRRKLILATNLAETSLTIDGVTTVVDSGLARFPAYDPARGLDRLELRKISRASADQRAGRAGRTGPGRCIRLWSERNHAARAPFETPEIEGIDLSATLLAVHAWGCSDAGSFPWFQPPRPEAIAAAERLLHDLGALDGGRLTALGNRMRQVPAHPRLGRLVAEGAALGLLEESATLAALLGEKDFIRREAPVDGASAFRPREPAHHGRSDLLERVDLLREAEACRFAASLRGRGIDAGAARRVAQVRDALARAAGQTQTRAAAEPPPLADDALLELLMCSYPDRVARRRATDPMSAVLAGGRGVRLSAASVVRDAPFFLAVELQDERRGAAGSGEAIVHLASEIQPEWLERCFPSEIRERTEYRFDEARGRAVAVRQWLYRDLVLAEETQVVRDMEAASRALAEHLARDTESLLRADESAAAILDRIEFLRECRPEFGWPDFDDSMFAAIVADACAGKGTLDEVRRVALAPLVRARLTYEQAKALDELAPEALVLPSGNRARLRYEAGRPPVLAARIQELFGWAEAPRLGGGRVPILLHLLGPNFRPVQITDDLTSFWSTTYFQVRKDLRNRYPKHSWPEDPKTARAEAKGARRAR